MSTNVTTVEVNQAFTFKEQLMTAATATTAGASEEFKITLSGKDDCSFILVANPTSQSGSDVTVEFTGGDFWYSDKQPSKTATVAAGKNAVFSIDSAFIKQDDGTAIIKLTPVTRTATLAGIGVKIGYITK